MSQIFFQGALVNLLNPKTALFFFAFLPQFVTVGSGPVQSQILFLGSIFILMAIISDGLYAFLAGSFSNWLRGNSKIQKLKKYISGCTYIVLGVICLAAEPIHRR